jgi:glutamate N-acetyltransferase / amino-acid N-acetyltransferase
MATKISPLAPAAFPELPPVDGVALATGNSGTRYKGRDDLLFVTMTPETTVAGTLTRSLTCSAPVIWCRESLPTGSARALVVNAGNANAFTGKAGDATMNATVAMAASVTGAHIHEIYVASTGVIGQPLSEDAIAGPLADLEPKLGTATWEDAARAIMTTDTFPKGVVRTAEINGVAVKIVGFAKGSGMIAPDMATMLGFVFTDAAVPAETLQALTSASVDKSFNCATVDGDTSTSDTLLVFATGKAGNEPIYDPYDPALAGFAAALEDALIDLAKQIVRDGEGATKFVSVTVTGAESDDAAKRVALTVANSPLVKTAIAGEDANWGRIVAAVGRAGERAERDLIKITMGGVLICADGMEVPGYDEAPVTAHMKGLEVDIVVDLGLGDGKATVWTCDLTHGYIDINGSYRS